VYVFSHSTFLSWAVLEREKAYKMHPLALLWSPNLYYTHAPNDSGKIREIRPFAWLLAGVFSSLR